MPDDVIINKAEIIERCIAGLGVPAELSDSLKKMVGFRNVAVHDYREIDFAIVKAIIERNFPDFRELIRLGLRAGASPDLDAPRGPQV
jgi:uncharacterized protein YutE (UPF0331/DUF86 family)